MIEMLSKWVLGKRWADPSAITAERLSQVFRWSELKGQLGDSRPCKDTLGQMLSIHREPQTIIYRRAFKNFAVGDEIHYPAHLVLGVNPEFAYIRLVDNSVEFRHTRTGENSAEARTATITLSGRIAGVFEEWYLHLGLPESLDTLQAERDARAARKTRFNGKMEWLQHYLLGEVTFSQLSESDDVLLWVDWRQPDDEIVTMCEGLIKSGELSAECVPHEETEDLLISMGARQVKVAYPAPEADRDTTLSTLNQVIGPAYEMRFVVESDGSDTLAFLPLRASEWAALEQASPSAVAQRFRTISPGDVFFG